MMHKLTKNVNMMWFVKLKSKSKLLIEFFLENN